MAATTKTLRAFAFPVGVDYASDAFQSSFRDIETNRPIPNTVVRVGGEVAVLINSLGCFGSEPGAGGPLLGFFGDSAVMGTVWLNGGRGFPNHVTVPGVEVVNAGMQGANMEQIVDRALELRQSHDLQGAVIATGGHNLVYGASTEAYWRQQFDRLTAVPRVAHMSLALDINTEAIDQGYEALLTPGGLEASKQPYLEAHPLLRYREGRVKAANSAYRFNEFLARYCAEQDRLFLDVRPLMQPKSMAEVGLRFSDIGHFRHSTYPELAEYLSARLTSWWGAYTMAG